MSAPTVILSPHFDDAVLSCWTVLTGPGEVRVVNVFGGSPPDGRAGWWDNTAGLGDPAEAVAARIEEDRRALAKAGRVATQLDFLDAQYRERLEQPTEPLERALADAVAPGSVVYAPAAVGPLPDDYRAPYPRGAPHPDHAALRTAALGLAARGHELHLYADFPHASIYGLPSWVAGEGAPVSRADELWARMLRSDGLAS
ncbi:MAG TPA: PIG-L family deacetylase, partial [Solirubrobacterales bacterium]|nr:PIG-L family deacetylase [Solirubrobacterales bacterium]